VPFYRDAKRRALAINAANRGLRNKWARAETIFNGTSGTYDATITTLLEKDGESSYRLIINNHVIENFTNPEASRDYEPMVHTWANVSLKTGDIIAIEARTHTNGKIQERVGSAWSRGRWRGLTLSQKQVSL